MYLSSMLDLLSHYRLKYFGPQPLPTTSARQAETAQPSPAASGDPDSLWSEPSAWVRGLEEAHKRNIHNAKASKSSTSEEDISRSYREVRAKLDDLERIRPQLDALVAALER